MPVISHRAAEQRDGAEWSARQLVFQSQMVDQGAFSATDLDSDIRVQLASYRTGDGFRARGSAFLVGDSMERQALLVHAALRGPLAVQPQPAAPAAGADTLDPHELRCLSEAIFYEARGEAYRGQVAVGQVVLNRTKSKHYPGTICGVVYQGHQRATGCQFTFTCDGSLNRRPRGRSWERAQNIAAQVMLGYTRSVVGRSTHYHTTAVNPIWNALLVRTTQVGEHLFYRFPSRSERAVLQASYDARRARVPAIDATASEPSDLAVDSITPDGIDEAAAEAAVVTTVSAPLAQAVATQALPAANAPIATAPAPSVVEAVPPPADDALGAMEVAT